MKVHFSVRSSQDFVRRFNQYYESYEIDNWNPEKGYSENIPPENVFPFRSLGKYVTVIFIYFFII